MDGSAYGPYTTKEIIELDIPDDTLVREDGIAEWKEAKYYDFQYLLKNTERNDTSILPGFVINSNETIKRQTPDVLIEPRVMPNNEMVVNETVSNGYALVKIKKWNWGAFFFSWLWASCNNIYWPLVLPGLNVITYFAPAFSLYSSIVYIIISILLGINGNEWAWKAKRWESVEQFKKVQSNWAKAIIYVLIGSVVLGVVLGILIVLVQ